MNTRKRVAVRLLSKPLNSWGLEVCKKNRGKFEIDYDWAVRFAYFKDRYDAIADIDGDIVECGVGPGNSLFMLCCLAKREGKGRKIWAFDSFEGFPEPSPEDISPRNAKKGELAKSTPDSIRDLFVNKGRIAPEFLDAHLKLVTGFFADTLAQFTGKKIALLHLDVDLYQSYRDTLEALWPKVSPGGTILFDEYGTESALAKWPGAVKAIDEHLGDLKEDIEYDRHVDRAFIFKR